MTVRCGNTETHHPDAPPAVAYLSWPDGRFKPTTACRVCLTEIVHNLVEAFPGDDEDRPLLIEPVTGHRRYVGVLTTDGAS